MRGFLEPPLKVWGPNSVLVGYRYAHFWRLEGENQRGTLGNRIFFCWGGLTKGVAGGQEPTKTLPRFFNQQVSKKLKCKNVRTDNRQVPPILPLWFFTIRNLYDKYQKISLKRGLVAQRTTPTPSPSSYPRLIGSYYPTPNYTTRGGRRLVRNSPMLSAIESILITYNLWPRYSD